MQLIFIHGPAAAGKYTIGSLLSEATGIPLFHNHLVVDVAKSLFAFGEPGFVRIRAAMWRVCFEEIAKAQQSIIFTFHPERTVAPALIEELVAIYRNAGGEVHFVELRCADETILQRIGNESRQQFGKLTDAEVFTAIKEGGGFEFPPLPAPLLTIDTARHSPQESADQIIAALAQI